MSARTRRESPQLAAWRRAVLERDGWQCRCGCRQVPVEAHHIIGKRGRRTRFLVENGVALARECHDYAHGHPAMFRATVDAWFGAGHYERLRRVRDGGEG